jgi:hypothetical protein
VLRLLAALRANMQTARCPTALGFERGNFEHPETTGYEMLLPGLPEPKAPDALGNGIRHCIDKLRKQQWFLSSFRMRS